MIRVMHVITGLDQGGAEAMLVRLLGGLDRQQFSQSVVSLTTAGIYGDQIDRLGVPLKTLGMTGFLSMPRSVLTLTRTMREQKPDIVQTWLYHADLIGLVSARMAGNAAVAWNVRCSSLLPGDPRSTRVVRWLLAALSHWPDAVLFNSTAGRESHRAFGYRPIRSEVIPNGFDLNERRPDPFHRADFRSEIGVDDDMFLVGMIARSHRVKDQTTFLAAASRLKGMSDAVRFVMVGSNHDWKNRSLVAEIDQYGLRDHIVLLGPRHDVPRIMAGLDCLVSTSTSEGFPNVIGEAMACGVPCVATDAGDSRLIVGDAGVIIAVGDVAGVVAGVSHLMGLAPDERELLSRHCRQRISDHFDLRYVAWRYAQFYRELKSKRAQAVAKGPASRAPVEPVRVTELPRAVESMRPVRVPVVSSGRTSRSLAAIPLLYSPARPLPETVSRRGRRLGAAALTMVVLWVAIFHTPLVWFAGNQLTIRQLASKADAIVVFSGNGHSSYINDSYQQRARDAARYYKGGYAPLVIISSGIQQTFAEVEIIRALLLSQGVPASAMYIVPDYPSSTYANVRVVRDVLRERGLHSILFITAPYHSRRASLIWRKLAPEIAVTTVPVVDTPPSTPQWTANVDQIKAIGYEYLAIMYNRSKGWL